MFNWSPRRSKELGGVDFVWGNTWEISRNGERHLFTDSRAHTNIKQDKQKVKLYKTKDNEKILKADKKREELTFKKKSEK